MHGDAELVTFYIDVQEICYLCCASADYEWISREKDGGSRVFGGAIVELHKRITSNDYVFCNIDNKVFAN